MFCPKKKKQKKIVKEKKTLLKIKVCNFKKHICNYWGRKKNFSTQILVKILMKRKGNQTHTPHQKRNLKIKIKIKIWL